LAHANHEPLRRMALFDVIANNADRKAGHILRTGEDIGWTEDDLVLGVDHGVTFHHEDKLRTVLWGFSGDLLTEQEMLLVHAVTEVAPEALAGLLTDQEIAATIERAEALIAAGHFPEPGDRWPVIPWPPV